jgi:hypothetical protein
MPSAPLEVHQQIVAGDDCKAADGRALTWTSGPVQPWPDLAGATLTMLVGQSRPNLGIVPVAWTGTVPGSPAAPTTVSLDVTAAQTILLPEGEFDYQLSAVLADSDTVTIAQGKLTVWAAPGTPPLFPGSV